MKKDLEILGLSEGAKWTEIQDAFDKLSNEYDPNNNDDLDFFVEEFEKINKAYENLKDNYEENEQSRNDKKSSNKRNTTDDLIISQNILKSILEKYSYKSDDSIHEIILSFENKSIIINNKTTFTNIPPIRKYQARNLKSTIIIPMDDITEIFFEEKFATDFLIFKSLQTIQLNITRKKRIFMNLFYRKT